LLANNIVASNSSGIWRYPYLSYQPVLNNNCLSNGAANYVNLPAGAGDIIADPEFLNAGAGDYRLSGTSPCVDAGTNNGAPLLDRDGVARPLDGRNVGSALHDIGAYEYANPMADTDRDSMPDPSEIIAGTSPVDAGSVLKLEGDLDAVQQEVVLRWPSVAGRFYKIEFKASMDPSGAWEMMEESIPGTGSIIERRDAVSTSARFYRAGVRLP